MNNNYLLVYDNLYSLNKKIDEVIKKFSTDSFDKNVYDLEQTDLTMALTDLDTYSFLSDKKVIIINNIDLLEEDNNTKHLLKYLENPNDNNLLIMTSRKFNLNKKINKELKNKCNYFKLEVDIDAQVKNMLDGYKVEVGVIKLLKEYSNDNIDIIETECNKLKQYKYDTKEITKEDVSKMCIKHLGESNNIIFDLVRDIACKNRKMAIKNYQSLKDYNVDDMALLGLLESQLRLMIQVDMLLDRRLKKDEIAKELSQHPFRIQKTIELLREVSRKDIYNLVHNLSKLDYNIKSGIWNTKDSMFIYIINL